LAVLTRASV